MGFWREFKKESQRANLANKNLERLDLLSKKLFTDLIEFELGSNPYEAEMNFSQGIYSIVIESRMALQDSNSYNLFQYSAVFALIHLRSTTVAQQDLFEQKNRYKMTFMDYGCFELNELFTDLKYINYGYSDKIISKFDWENSHKIVSDYIFDIKEEVEKLSKNNKLMVTRHSDSVPTEVEVNHFLTNLENENLFKL
jgi:hypothetical protein